MGEAGSPVALRENLPRPLSSRSVAAGGPGFPYCEDASPWSLPPSSNRLPLVFLCVCFPLPALIKTCLWMKSESESCSVLSDSLQPRGLYSPWNSPGRNTGVGSHSLLQGIFPTLGLSPGLPQCRQILYQLSHKGSPLDVSSIPVQDAVI